jgi:hypothetical protein
MEPITTGKTEGMGLRWARSGIYRVVAHRDGCYTAMVLRPFGGWGLFEAGEAMLPEIERALCAALGIRCKGDYPCSK